MFKKLPLFYESALHSYLPHILYSYYVSFHSRRAQRISTLLIEFILGALNKSVAVAASAVAYIFYTSILCLLLGFSDRFISSNSRCARRVGRSGSACRRATHFTTNVHGTRWTTCWVSCLNSILKTTFILLPTGTCCQNLGFSWVSFQSSKGLFNVLNFVLEFDLEDDAYSFAPHFPWVPCSLSLFSLTK